MESKILALLIIAIMISPILTFEGEAVSGKNTNGVSIEYLGTADSVQVIGEWDWSAPVEMTEVNGKWSANLELSEGLYCYKLIVDGEYIFDPNNPERGFCGDIENSLLRVKDHNRPQFSAEITGDILVVYYLPGSNGDLLTNTPSAIDGAIWNPVEMSWTYDLTTLDEGKHSFLIEGIDTNGFEAYDLLVPFWIGNHSEFEWQDALIYMIMTDRFVNGNESNDGDSTLADHGAQWQGGDFAGVTQMIQSGYFSDLGVNALWLSPFNKAATETGKAADGQHDVSAFHGYWPISAREIEPRLGTEQELREMIDTAHDSGIRVMMDFVVNHVHEDHPYYTENPDWFNSGCICGTSSCDWTEYRLECLFTSYMPDVNWKNRNASEQFISDALWWLETYNLDGARIDAVKHVDDLAVRNLVSQINQRFETVGTDYYLKGETAMGWSGHSLEANQEQYGTINSYMGPNGLDGQADFVLYHAVVDNVFVNKNENYQHLDYWTNRSQDQYIQDSIMVPYVGSHDVPRIISRADTGTNDAYNQWVENGLPGQPGSKDAYDDSLQAYGWLLTTPGAPLLYYGDEYGEYGGADPDNRHMYRNSSTWNSFETQLFENISAIGKIRLESEALRRGSYSTIYAESDRLVFAMTYGNQEMNVILNRGTDWNWNDFDDNDILHFGGAYLQQDDLVIIANSVTIIEKIPNSELVIAGCTDSTATNFDADATQDDGSCEYQQVEENNNSESENNESQIISGCMDSSALNYNSLASINDGSCNYEEESKESQNSDSKSVSKGFLVRIILLICVVVALVVLLTMKNDN